MPINRHFGINLETTKRDTSWKYTFKSIHYYIDRNWSDGFRWQQTAYILIYNNNNNIEDHGNFNDINI